MQNCLITELSFKYVTTYIFFLFLSVYSNPGFTKVYPKSLLQYFPWIFMHVLLTQDYHKLHWVDNENQAQQNFIHYNKKNKIVNFSV